MASDNEASCASDPNFAVICSFLECFGKSCGIVYPDIARLQEMLEDTQEVPQPLIDLHIKLLRKTRKTVCPEKWERALVKFGHTYSNQDGWELERFGYKKARIAVKLRLLKVLLEAQFDLNQKFKNEVNKLAANELRVEPLGRDKSGLAYWCQLDEECNIRVYREDIDEENWELVAKDREQVVELINTLTNGEAGPIPVNEDSNSLEISEKPIIDTGQVTTSPSIEDDLAHENGPVAENQNEKEFLRNYNENSENEQKKNNRESNIINDIEDGLSNDDNSKENIKNSQEISHQNSISPKLNGKIEDVEKHSSELSLDSGNIAKNKLETISNSTEFNKISEINKESVKKADIVESVFVKSIETPVITSPLKLVNNADVKKGQDVKNNDSKSTIISSFPVIKKSTAIEESVDPVMKSLEKLSSKNNMSYTTVDPTVGHAKLSIKPIDQLAANLVRIQSEKLEKPSGPKSLEKIAENLARSGSIVTNTITNGDDERLLQDYCSRNQNDKTPVRAHRGMDLSTSPRSWENPNEQNKPVDFLGIDLSSRKFAKTVDLPSPGYRAQEFQHREMDLSTKKTPNKQEDITEIPYDARTVMMRNQTMVADLSKRQLPFTAYEMSAPPYHNSPRLTKDEHRLPGYSILPDPSKLAALKMAGSSVKRTADDGEQQEMLKRIRSDVIPIRGSVEKKSMMSGNWRDEVSEAIEDPTMMIQGEGSGSECDAVNPIVGETIEEPTIFFYGEGSGVDNDTGNPGDEAGNDTKDSNESKTAEVDSQNKIHTDDSLMNDVTSKSSVKLNRNFPQSSLNVNDNCQNATTPEKPKFKPTLGVQIIPKSAGGTVKRLSRWDVGKPDEKLECDSSVISNKEDISEVTGIDDLEHHEDESSRVHDNELSESRVESKDSFLEESMINLESATMELEHRGSSVSSYQVDTSNAVESSNVGDFSTNLLNATKEIDESLHHNKSKSQTVDDSYKSLDSPPRFFFGPNCVSYVPKSDEQEITINEPVENKVDALQYECVSSKKSTDSTACQQDNFDKNQINNNSLKITSLSPESSISKSKFDEKEPESELVQKTLTHNLRHDEKSEEKSNSFPSLYSNFHLSDVTKKDVKESNNSNEEITYVDNSFNENVLEMAQSESTSILSSCTDEKPLEFNRIESSNEPENTDDSSMHLQSTDLSCTNDNEKTSESVELSLSSGDDLKLVKEVKQNVDNKLTSDSSSHCEVSTENKIMKQSEVNSDDQNEAVVNQEVNTTILHEVGSGSPKFETNKSDYADSTINHENKQERRSSTDLSIQNDLLTETDTEKREAISSDADSMSANYDKSSERIDSLSDLGLQDEASGDSTEPKDINLRDTCEKDAILEDNMDVDCTENTDVVISSSIQNFSNDESASLVCSSAEVCPTEIQSPKDNSKTMDVDNDESTLLAKSAAVIDSHLIRLSVLNDINMTEEKAQSSFVKISNKTKNNVSHETTLHIEQSLKEKEIIGENLVESNESLKEPEFDRINVEVSTIDGIKTEENQAIAGEILTQETLSEFSNVSESIDITTEIKQDSKTQDLVNSEEGDETFQSNKELADGQLEELSNTISGIIDKPQITEIQYGAVESDIEATKNKNTSISESEENSQTVSEENVQTVSEENVQTVSEENVQTVSEENVQTVSEENVQTVSEENVQTVSEENVQTVSEENGQTVSEENGQTVSEENVKPSLVANYGSEESTDSHGSDDVFVANVHDSEWKKEEPAKKSVGNDVNESQIEITMVSENSISEHITEEPNVDINEIKEIDLKNLTINSAADEKMDKELDYRVNEEISVPVKEPRSKDDNDFCETSITPNMNTLEASTESQRKIDISEEPIRHYGTNNRDYMKSHISNLNSFVESTFKKAESEERIIPQTNAIKNEASFDLEENLNVEENAVEVRSMNISEKKQFDVLENVEIEKSVYSTNISSELNVKQFLTEELSVKQLIEKPKENISEIESHVIENKLDLKAFDEMNENPEPTKTFTEIVNKHDVLSPKLEVENNMEKLTINKTADDDYVNSSSDVDNEPKVKMEDYKSLSEINVNDSSAPIIVNDTKVNPGVLENFNKPCIVKDELKNNSKLQESFTESNMVLTPNLTQIITIDEKKEKSVILKPVEDKCEELRSDVQECNIKSNLVNEISPNEIIEKQIVEQVKSEIQPMIEILPENIKSTKEKKVDLEDDMFSDDSVGVDNEDIFCAPQENMEVDEDSKEIIKEVSETVNCESTKIEIHVQPVIKPTYEEWKLDSTETVSKVSRKRRNSEQDVNSDDQDEFEGDDGEFGNKRIKLRGKRSPDLQLRKSVEESREAALSSEDETVKETSTISVETEEKIGTDGQQVAKRNRDRKSRGRRRRRRGHKKLKPKAVGSDAQTTDGLPSDMHHDSSVVVSLDTTVPSTQQKKRKKRKMVLGLEIGRDIETEAPVTEGGDEAPVRQSRRIAQLKIKEEADRRRIEEETLNELKEKKENADKKKKKKSKPDSDEDVVMKDIDRESQSKKKRRKKKKMMAKFNESQPWQSSSGSDSENDDENEEEEEEEEIESEGSLSFKSDHEFSPESDLEKDLAEEPARRARTAQKSQSDIEEADDEYACQKCGKADHPEWILLCDSCDKGWHCSCLRPALMLIPEGDWFCPPCQHNTLVLKLRDSLKSYDQLTKRHENELLRKKRLAFVGISLDNVIQKNEAEQSEKESSEEDDDGSDHDQSNDDDDDEDDDDESTSSSSESGSGSACSSSEESEPVYQLRERRCANTYKFNEYDDMINAAIQDEVEAVQGAGNQGRGKDIATIVNAEKEEAQAEALKIQEMEEEKEEIDKKSEKDSDEDYKIDKDEEIMEDDDEPQKLAARKLLARKKHRKLNSLDISSEDDPESDEDFKGTSSDEEEDFDDHISSSEESSIDNRRRRKGDSRPVRRSTRARMTRYDNDFINDDSEESDPPKRKKLWGESDSEDSDNSWGRRKKRSRTTSNSRSRTVSKTKSKKKKKRKRIIENQSSDNQSENEGDAASRFVVEYTPQNIEPVPVPIPIAAAINTSVDGTVAEPILPETAQIPDATLLNDMPETIVNIIQPVPILEPQLTTESIILPPVEPQSEFMERKKKDIVPKPKKIRRKIIYGGLPDENRKNEEDEILSRRTRGRKINYQEVVASDSEEELKKALRRTGDSEEEFVVHDGEDFNEDVEKDSDSGDDEYSPKKDGPKLKNKSPKYKRLKKTSGAKRKNFEDDGTPKQRKKPGPKPGSKNKPRNPLGDLATDSFSENMGLSVTSSLTDPSSLAGLGSAELAELDDEQLEQMMMEDEEYGRRQLELAAIEIAKKKKKEEREAKKMEKARQKALEILAAEQQSNMNAMDEGDVPKRKKRGRKSKAEILAEQMRRDGASSLSHPGIMPATMADMTGGMPPGLNQSIPNIMAVEADRTSMEGQMSLITGPDGQLFNPDGSPVKPKRRGRGKGKKTLALEAARAAEAAAKAAAEAGLLGLGTDSNPDLKTGDIPNILPTPGSSTSGSAPSTPPAMAQGPSVTTPNSQQVYSPIIPGQQSSVITRMLQSQPAASSPQSFSAATAAMGHKYFGAPNVPPPATQLMPGPRTAYDLQRGRIPGAYRQPGQSPLPPHFAAVRSNTPPMRMRVPGPGMYHTAHHPMDPSPSGGGPIAISSRDRSSPLGPATAMIPPAAGSPLAKGGPTPPPPPYIRSGPQMSRFADNPMGPRHQIPPFTNASPVNHGIQQPSPPPNRATGNFSPYHPPPPPNYHYGAYPPPPPMSTADDAAAYQSSPYPPAEHFTAPATDTSTIQAPASSQPSVAPQTAPPTPQQQAQSQQQSTAHPNEPPGAVVYKQHDEEGTGEFGGLVSYFSSQREDDLDS